jgi:hypothetical protein
MQHCKDANGRDALMVASQYGRIPAKERLLHHIANVLTVTNGQNGLPLALSCQSWNAAVLLLVHGANENVIIPQAALTPRSVISRGLKMRVKVPRFRRSTITEISDAIADVPSTSGFPKVPVLTHIVAEYAGYSIVEALQLLEPQHNWLSV